jgi:serine/threonine protein kinase
VYRAEHLHLRKPHALKVLLPEWSSMPEVVARFEREAVAAGNIQSPHVAAATDFGRLRGGAFYLVMEYVQGRTLRADLEAGAIAPGRALHILRGIVAALRAAHAMGIVHRDLKPENIMLVERNGDRDFVKVLDFGIAKVDALDTGRGGAAGEDASKTPLTRVGTIIGTPKYMSPEQALGQPVDARSDLYSAGVIFFEMLTGFCPFEGDAVTVLRQRILEDAPELPADVAAGIEPRTRALVRQLLAKSRENRFASAADLMAALDECSSEPEPLAPPSPGRASLEPLEGIATPTGRNARSAALAGVEAIEAAVRRTLADPRSLLRHPSRVQIVVGGVVAAVVATMFVALFAAGRTPSVRSSAVAGATDSATAVAPAVPSSEPTASVEVPTLSVLPPPPAPSSSTGAGLQPSTSAPGRPAPSQGPSRRTGPGGIYVPPPNQWFK